MYQVSPTVDNVDHVSDAFVTTPGIFDEIEGMNDWYDDRARCEAAAADAELALVSDHDDRTPPPAAPARSTVILTNGGYVGACSTVVRGDTIGAVKFTPAEAAAYLAARPTLRGAVVAPIACPLCVAGSFHGSESCRATFAPAPTIAANDVTPATGWETRVGTARKGFEAAIKTPAGKVIKCGKFATEAAAWEAARVRLAAEKSKAA
jgi:hypothetical protein